MGAGKGGGSRGGENGKAGGGVSQQEQQQINSLVSYLREGNSSVKETKAKSFLGEVETIAKNVMRIKQIKNRTSQQEKILEQQMKDLKMADIVMKRMQSGK